MVPFRVGGAAPELGYLREGMMDLVAARLTGGGGARAADPRAVMAALPVRAAMPAPAAMAALPAPPRPAAPAARAQPAAEAEARFAWSLPLWRARDTWT